jgi:Cu/Ag efflux protein CusF
MRQSAKLGRVVAACAIAASALGFAAYPAPSSADQNSPTNPETAAAQIITASGTVLKIDKDKRLVTVKGDRGYEVEAKVSPNVNLDKVKVGDRVSAAYYEEVAVSLHKQGEQAPKMTQTVTERGGVTAEQTTVTAKVVSVDKDNNEVEFRGPSGGNHMVKVEDPDMQAQLAKIRSGDNVDVTYTQAIAVSIEPMKK